MTGRGYHNVTVTKMDMPEQFKVTPWDGVSIKEQGYNPSLAVLRLSKTYSEDRLETACEFAITKGIKKSRHHHLKSILAANQDIS